MNRKHKARIGTISHGTLRNEDLLESFTSELAWLGDEDPQNEIPLLKEAIAADPESEEASEIINELADALNDLAPPYCYFGSSEGDGSDFGFWPCMESINNLPRVEDSDEAKALGTDCCFVNDHGNITIFGGDGSTLIDFV